MTTLTLERKRDNTTGRPPSFGLLGAHPAGTGFGAAAGGAAAGALAGTVVGPVGTVLGAVAGAVAGALAGDQIAETIDASAEEVYWRENYSSRPYVTAGATLTSIALPIATASMRIDGSKAVRLKRWKPT